MYLSPTGVLINAPPAASIAAPSPPLESTVTTTSPPGSAPRAIRSSASMPMSWSPSTTVPVASTATHRSASPSSANPMSAPCASTSAASDAGAVAPHARLMFDPSGPAWIVATRAPDAAKMPDATSDAAPFAQSSTTWRSVRMRAAIVERWRTYAVAQLDAPVVDAPDRRRPRRRRARPPAR